MPEGTSLSGPSLGRMQEGGLYHRRAVACRAGISLLVALPAFWLCLAAGSHVQAKGTYEPPRNGLESPDKPHRMKSNPGAGGMVDAYGFPVQNVEPERPQARRLPPCAYGSYGDKGKERPLPGDSDSRPLWR